MAIKKRTTAKKTGRLNKSHQKIETGKKAEEEVVTENRVAKMVFDSDYFEDEAAVEAYLKAAEWEADETTIIENEDGDFEVRGDGLTDDDFVKIEKVETDEDGVEAFIGLIEVSKSEDDEETDDEDEEEDDDASSVSKSDDDEDEDEEDEEEDGDEEEVAKGGKKKPYKKAAKSEEPKKLSKRAEFLAKRKETRSTEQKFDPWDARYSKGNTVAKALSDGMSWDKTPPGYYDVQAAFNSAVANIVSSDDMDNKQEALNKAASDYAEIIGSLDTYFDQFIAMDPETVEKHFDTEEDREAVQKWADGYGDFVAGVSEAPEPSTIAKSSDAASVTIDYKQIGESVATPLTKALEPVLAQIGEIAETVDAMSTRAPHKKAAEPDDGGPAGPRLVKTKKKDDDEDTRKAEQKSFTDRAIFG